MNFTFLLIGENNLLIQCGELLLQKKQIIKCIISSVPLIKSWSEKNNILCFDSLTELPSDFSVDYLFSIVNGIILTKEHLKMARLGSINYHDSPLPKFAGVHATTWSIMQEEKKHGITWHFITEGIDEGDIVYQSEWQTFANETTLSLN